MPNRNPTPTCDPIQKIIDADAILAYVSGTKIEDVPTEAEIYGRHLMIEHCRDLLRDAQGQLWRDVERQKVQSLEVANA